MGSPEFIPVEWPPQWFINCVLFFIRHTFFLGLGGGELEGMEQLTPG